MTSALNPQERSRKYIVNIAGVEFTVEYKPGVGWVLKSPLKRVIVAKRAKSFTQDRMIAKIRKLIIKQKCGDDRECAKSVEREIDDSDIIEALTSQFISRVSPRQIAVVNDDDIEVQYTPMFYSPSAKVAGILTWRKTRVGDETRYEPRLILVKYLDDGNVALLTSPSAHLLDIIRRPMHIDNLEFMVDAPAYDEALAADDVAAAEEVASNMAYGMLKLMGPAWPREEHILYWYDRIKSNPEAWLRWLYAEVIDRIISKWTWHKLKGRRILSLIPLAIDFAPIFDFLLHIMFVGRRGAGKSMHIATVAALAPYTLRASQATVAVLDRLRTHALNMAFDEFTPEQQHLYWYIRSYAQEGVKFLTAPDRKGVIAFTGGWNVLVPDLGQIAEHDNSGAATSRSIEFHLVTDRSVVRIRDPIRYIRRTYKRVPLYHGLGPDGREATIYIRDLYALEVALFLHLADKVYQMYEELDREVDEKAKRGELGIEGRRVVSFVPLIVIARLIGQDVEAEVWRYLRETSEESPSPTFMAVIDALRLILEKGDGDADIREQIRKLELDDKYVLLVKPSAILDVVVKMVREGSVPGVTERARIEEGENATLRKVELWPRRTVPEDLQSAQRFERWLTRETYYARHLLGFARDKTGRDRKHLFLTYDVIDLFESEAWRNLDAAEEAFKRICADAKILVETYPNVIHKSHPLLRECSADWRSGVEKGTPLDKGGGGEGAGGQVEKGVETRLPLTNMETERAEAESGSKAVASAESRLPNDNTTLGNSARGDLSPVSFSTLPPDALHRDKSQTEDAVSSTILQSAESFKEENNVSNTQVEKEKVADSSTDGERWVAKPEDVVKWVKSLGKRTTEREL